MIKFDKKKKTNKMTPLYNGKETKKREEKKVHESLTTISLCTCTTP